MVKYGYQGSGKSYHALFSTLDEKERLQRALALISSHDKMDRRFSLFKLFHLLFAPFRYLLYAVGSVFYFFLNHLYAFALSFLFVLLAFLIYHFKVDYAYFTFLIGLLIGILW